MFVLQSVCIATVKFLAHLVNQHVLYELVALELLTLLLEEPTDDSVEVAVGFVKVCLSVPVCLHVCVCTICEPEPPEYVYVCMCAPRGEPEPTEYVYVCVGLWGDVEAGQQPGHSCGV